MLVHLQIISAESDKITESKLKLSYVRRASYRKKSYFFVVSVCLRFEWPVKVAQIKTTHLLRVVCRAKKIACFGRNVVNTF